MQRLINDEQNNKRAAWTSAPPETRARSAEEILAEDSLHLDETRTHTDSLQTESQTQASDARRRARVRALLIQPPVYWAVLMVVAAATGMLSVSNPSVRQPILLHTVPLLLTFLAGYRLKDPKLGAVSGLTFHVTRAVLIFALAAGPQFLRVMNEYPGQLLWLFALMPAMGWLGGTIGQRMKSPRQGPTPSAAGGAAAAAGLIALTTLWITPRFLHPPMPMDAAPPIADPFLPGGGVPAGTTVVPPMAAVAPLGTMIETGDVRIANEMYRFERTVKPAESLDLPAGLASDAAELTPNSPPVSSPDGTTQFRVDENGLQRMKTGQSPSQIASNADGPISQLTTNKDGNMNVFNQNGDYMVHTPSKGTRPLEDLLRQFGKDIPFEVADGSVTAAAFDKAGENLFVTLTDPRTGDPVSFVFNLLRR